MKKFILGFISGGILAAAVTGFAVEYAITANPYPIKVNGQAAAIEGYNINDSSYFKLRDVAEAIGGFNVDFVNNEITLTTNKITPTIAPTAAADVKNVEPLPELPTVTRQGKEYVSKPDINDMLKSIGLGNYGVAGDFFYDERDMANSLLTDIPLYENDDLLIPADYYITVIIPLINGLR